MDRGARRPARWPSLSSRYRGPNARGRCAHGHLRPKSRAAAGAGSVERNGRGANAPSVIANLRRARPRPVRNPRSAEPLSRPPVIMSAAAQWPDSLSSSAFQLLAQNALPRRGCSCSDPLGEAHAHELAPPRPGREVQNIVARPVQVIGQVKHFFTQARACHASKKKFAASRKVLEANAATRTAPAARRKSTPGASAVKRPIDGVSVAKRQIAKDLDAIGFERRARKTPEGFGATQDQRVPGA